MVSGSKSIPRTNTQNSTRTTEPNAATLKFQVHCGAFFREKRILAKKSEADVAAYLGVSTEILGAYENGKEGIPLFRVHMLSNCLSIHPDEITSLFNDLA